MKYIYVIGSNKEGPLKIGISVEPNKRLKQLQTGNMSKLEIFYKTELLEHAEILERIIHKTIKLHRTSGEWFNITLENAINEINFCLITHNDNKSLKSFYKNKLINI